MPQLKEPIFGLFFITISTEKYLLSNEKNGIMISVKRKELKK